MSELPLLLQLQDRDSAIDRLQYRSEHLGERSVLLARHGELGDLDTQIGRVSADLEAAVKSQTEAEDEAGSISDRIDGLDKQMYAGTVTAARDLQAMAHEIGSLKERLGAVEETILEIMEKVESLEAERASLAAERGEVVSAIACLEGEIRAAEEAIARDIDEQKAARAELAKSVSAGMLGRYESLRQRLGGVAVAILAQGRCEGCHLSLSSVALDRIRHAVDGDVATCDECGRMLVPQ